MSRLNVTVHEARQLFHNLQKGLRSICETESKELGNVSTAQANEEFESLWDVVDREFRNIYEMSRFGLEVQGLNEDTDDIDIFRGYCEDIDGIEPRDINLIHSISRETQAVQELLEHNALYRISIPDKVEEHFETHISKKRMLYAEILSPPIKTSSDTNINPPTTGLPPPAVLGSAMMEVADRLSKTAMFLSAYNERKSH